MLPVNRQKIPTSLTREKFDLFVFPHLSKGSRGPEIKINFHKVFNYLLYLLHTGCQWKNISIDKNEEGNTEIHHTRLFKIFKRWTFDGSILKAFTSSVFHLNKHKKLDIEILHGDGTTTTAKKGGDLTDFNGHKKMFGSKVVAIVDRNVNIICPFTVAAGNVNETTLLGDAILQLKQMFTQLGKSQEGIIMSLDSSYDSRKNRKLCFDHKIIPNIKEINRKRNKNKPGPKRIYEEKATGYYYERHPKTNKGHAQELDYFRHIIEENRPSETDVYAAGISNLMAEKAIESWKRGTVVHVTFLIYPNSYLPIWFTSSSILLTKQYKAMTTYDQVPWIIPPDYFYLAIDFLLNALKLV